MGLKVAVGEYGILGLGVVVVAAALTGARAGVVLHDSDDGAVAPAQVVAVLVIGGLQAGDKGLGQIAGQGGVLAVGAGGTGEDGSADQVDLGAQQHGDPHRAVGLRHLLAGLKGGLCVEGGAEAQLVDNAGNMVGVDGDGGGDAQVLALAQLLEGVGPGHGHSSIALAERVTPARPPARMYS